MEEILSIRIVIADFYMHKPTRGLDLCYSEFRGKEIKRVPIVRIFGSVANGRKTCMHVHGVFPYFYIPYEQKNFESVDKVIYQIALSVDKAINVSLGQGSSDAQHVFKIQLVKGVPFYGYHRSEHQFLKVFMYNPRFVRRAANLLQNGVILGRVFHPHESHVPYILQFLIDYNLYGMSYLHVPLEVVKFRLDKDSDVVQYSGIKDDQILSTEIEKKQSTCNLEVDIASNFILNRFQIMSKDKNLHSNPGIESIWHDEKVRRQQLVNDLMERDKSQAEAIPALEVPSSQERTNVNLTSSEEFYLIALQRKLAVLDTPVTVNATNESDDTISIHQSDTSSMLLNATNQLSLKEQKRTFNLKKLLANAVYPEECTQQDHLLNASHIENHMSNANIFQTTLNIEKCAEFTIKHGQEDKITNSPEDESVYLDNTLLDEDLLLNLTQKSSQHSSENLHVNDLELLDVLQQLEANCDDDHTVDLDSSLAQLSQTHKQFELTPELLDKEIVAAATKQPLSDNESDDENNDSTICPQDFSIALDDVDEFLLKISQTAIERKSISPPMDEPVPQVDGADDLMKTPTKLKNRPISGFTTPKRTSRSTTKNQNQNSPSRSPRTPKSRYAPLPLVFLSQPNKKNDINSINKDTSAVESSGISKVKNRAMSLRKTLAQMDLRQQSTSAAAIKLDQVISTTSESDKSKSKVVRRSRRIARNIDLEKTHVTCALTPRRKSTNERPLKVYTKAKNEEKEKGYFKEEVIPKPIVQCDLAAEEEELRKKYKLKRLTVKLRKFDAHKHLNENTQKKCESEIIALDDNNDNGNKGNDDDEVIDASDNEIDNSEENNRKLMKALTRVSKSFRMGSARRRRNEARKLADTVRREQLEIKSKVVHQSQRTPDSIHTKTPKTPRIIDESLDEDANIKSFYDISFSSPAVLSASSSPCLFAPPTECSPNDVEILTPSAAVHSPTTSATVKIENKSNTENVVCDIKGATMTPMDLPPTYSEVLAGCQKFDILENDFEKPFYSNPDDVTKHKEVGYTVLHIPSNKLNDIEEFESVLGTELNGLTAWRRKQLVGIGGAEMLNRYRNAQHVREYFANESNVIMTPQGNAPTRQAAKLWLKLKDLRESNQECETANAIEEDSPIKVRRQKVTMMLMEANGEVDDENNDLDTTVRSLTLTPLTPGTPLPSKSTATAKRPNATPLTTIEKTKSYSKQRGRMSLSEKFRKVALQRSQEETPHTDVVKLSQESTTLSTQSSDTTEVSSNNTLLGELDRSSFVKQMQTNTPSAHHDLSFGLSSNTLNNTFGFKVDLENLQQAKSDIECNYLTIITLELFVPTRGDLHPNPQFDEIRCIFYAIEHSVPSDTKEPALPNKAYGYIIVHDAEDIALKGGERNGLDSDAIIQVVETEMDAIQELLKLCAHWDADIYAGYEIEMSSWGYLLERAKHLYLDIGPLLSRVPSQKMREFVDEDRDQYTELDFEMKLCGRILLDVWRLMRSEIALTSYSFENVTYHILHKRCPWHSFRELSNWFKSSCSRWIVLEYYLERVRGTLALLEQLDLIGRTSEMAKLIGIQFYEVLSRGSQFRVESMMLRIAKPKNLVPLSPSVQQRAHMRAPEYLPLILEPQSRFYVDPVIVLDFQSLYPSMIIGYNYCFSTCLGRVEHLGQATAFEFGASQLRVSPSTLRKLMERNLITVSPCGVVFVKSSVREGILPRMLTEILDTRQMVKQSMKLHKSSSALQRVLHSRQLGLKLMANVTYGYTAANFSGRMPAVEVGDSVVAKGRETLERAIKLVEANEKWRVKVVYGDTDSMFVLVPGRDRKEAFRIGAEIAEAVTQANPQPVKLKLEKVYQPCILQTKKRYVGYMYETPEQDKPIYEAKGIETVRRDGCPAVAKMLEKVLRILFETTDVSQIKRYVCRQFTKLLSGRANLQDLIFAKEFRGLNGYKPKACVPALALTRKWLQTDPRHIPRCGERVPFIIVNGPPGLPLIRLVRSPFEVLADESLKINSIYYITKAIIPPLNRCLLLIGADVNEWFSSLPRKLLLMPCFGNSKESHGPTSDISSLAGGIYSHKKSTISQYFSRTDCNADCGRQTQHGICEHCALKSADTFVVLQSKIGRIERSFQVTQQICQACCGRVGDLSCGSLDCPVRYVFEMKRRDLQQISYLRNLLNQYF